MNLMNAAEHGLNVTLDDRGPDYFIDPNVHLISNRTFLSIRVQ